MLLDAGALSVREVALQAFPDRLADIIVAYNNAIRTIFVSSSSDIVTFELS